VFFVLLEVDELTTAPIGALPPFSMLIESNVPVSLNTVVVYRPLVLRTLDYPLFFEAPAVPGERADAALASFTRVLNSACSGQSEGPRFRSCSGAARTAPNSAGSWRASGAS